MKYVLGTFLYSTLSPTLVACISLFIILGGIVVSSVSARCVNKHLNFLYYDKNFHPSWSDDGVFPATLSDHILVPHSYSLASQANLTPQHSLKRLLKKVRFTVSPKVVIKPFIIVEELQNLLFLYQFKKLREHAATDENFRAKTSVRPNQLARLKKIRQPKPFSVSPYHSKIYGLHLQITW